jgi:hypothetical protein
MTFLRTVRFLVAALGLFSLNLACSQDSDMALKKICNAASTRDCVCSDTSSGQQTCNEDGTRYGLCICGSVATDSGISVPDSHVDFPVDSSMPDGGNMMRPERGNMMPNRDGGNMNPNRDDAGRRIPPQASYDACMGLAEGDACTFMSPRRGEVMGTCQYRNGETALFCRPSGGGMGGGGMGGGGN